MKLRLGTRGSALALAQSGWVAERLGGAELVVIKTSGDHNRTSPLSSFGGKGIFTRELEEELLGGGIDFAVHSLKDLPTELPDGLTLCNPPRRADPRDLLVASVPLEELPEGAVVGTGSQRRQVQLKSARPDLQLEEIRGNVGTRVRKWREGQYDAVVLAAAGVSRLGLEQAGLTEADVHPLDPACCLPAPGQGILGLEIRQDNEPVRQILAAIADPDATSQALAERAFLRRLEGGCNIPAGALASIEGDEIEVKAVLGLDSGELLRATVRGARSEAERLGEQAAARLLEERG